MSVILYWMCHLNSIFTVFQYVIMLFLLLCLYDSFLMPYYVSTYLSHVCHIKIMLGMLCCVLFSCLSVC